MENKNLKLRYVFAAGMVKEMAPTQDAVKSSLRCLRADGTCPTLEEYWGDDKKLLTPVNFILNVAFYCEYGKLDLFQLNSGFLRELLLAYGFTKTKTSSIVTAARDWDLSKWPYDLPNTKEAEAATKAFRRKMNSSASNESLSRLIEKFN